MRLIVRREFSEEMQALVIFLRFVSLNTDKRIWLTPSEVFKRTGVRMSSQLKIIQRWRQRGFVIIRNKHPGLKERLTKDQVNWLISTDTLIEMSHLSLRRRAELVRQHLGLKTFSHVTLSKYYRKYNVTFKRPDYKYYKSIAQKENLKEK
jgi:transposase